MNNSNLATVENQEASELTIYSSGKFHRMYAKTINPYAALLVERMIAVCTRVELSEKVYWFYADDSEKVIFAIRQSDNLVHLALSDIGFDAKYWYKVYYNLGKRLVAHLVVSVEAKMQVAPKAPFDLVIVTKPNRPSLPFQRDTEQMHIAKDGHKFDVLEYSSERRVFQSMLSAVSYCMEVQWTVDSEEDPKRITTRSFINGRFISEQSYFISRFGGRSMSTLGNAEQAVLGAYDHLQSLVLNGKV